MNNLEIDYKSCFSKIASFHRVEVTYRTTGCFHHSLYLFDFDSKKNVVIYDCSAKKKLLGKYKISEDELKKLDLLKPIYKKTASYGHFGRENEGFAWENLDMVDKIKECLNLK